jgi:hypothetical protein
MPPPHLLYARLCAAARAGRCRKIAIELLMLSVDADDVAVSRLSVFNSK